MMSRRRALITDSKDLYFLKPDNWYTDTGIYGGPNYCFELGFEWTNTPTGNEYVFGVTNNSHNEYYHSLQGVAENSRVKLRAFRFNDPIYNNEAIEIAGGIRYDIRLDFTYSYYNLNINGISTYKSSSNLREVANTTYYFGALHCEGTTTGIRNTQEMKIFYFRIFPSVYASTPILEYIPKKLNGEVVLYDTINERAVTWVN